MPSNDEEAKRLIEAPTAREESVIDVVPDDQSSAQISTKSEIGNLLIN